MNAFISEYYMFITENNIACQFTCMLKGFQIIRQNAALVTRLQPLFPSQTTFAELRRQQSAPTVYGTAPTAVVTAARPSTHSRNFSREAANPVVLRGPPDEQKTLAGGARMVSAHGHVDAR